MQVKGNKAFATLTDVKNLIGDVFSLADKHGEVTITSYNKPKYVIKKLNRSERDAVALETEVAVETPKTVPQAEAAVVPDHPLQQPALQTKTSPANQLQSANGVLNSQPSALIEKLNAIFKDLDFPDLWDRISPREQTWVQNARDLI